MQRDPDKIAKQLADLAEEIHSFIAAWFRGDVEQSEALFNEKLAGHLAANFVNIQPSGVLLPGNVLLEALKSGHGANPAFQISIRDFTLHRFDPQEKMALATYIEDQKGALNTTPPDNARITTVLFEVPLDGSPPLIVHLHETALAA